MEVGGVQGGVKPKCPVIVPDVMVGIVREDADGQTFLAHKRKAFYASEPWKQNAVVAFTTAVRFHGDFLFKGRLPLHIEGRSRGPQGTLASPARLPGSTLC